MNIQRLESKYLDAKLAYYDGKPIMSDAEFDSLETILKKEGSKVIEQVGSKRKDFDFPHPTKMLSLAKIQTEKTKDGTNYATEAFMKWYNKRTDVAVPLFASPKFDGNAINIIYSGTKLSHILTRGNGVSGKNVTDRFKGMVENDLVLVDLDINENDTIEIRCEVAIDTKLFDEKYGKDFANPRNYVAGVIGKDDFDVVKVAQLSILPLHYLLNGLHVNQYHFSRNEHCWSSFDTKFLPEKYEETIKSFEELRKTYKLQLDGVVIAFAPLYREQLGENDHDPNWAIAIKYVPDEVVTSVEGIEWNVGKTGELTPVVLLKPVNLAGTTVRRASGYNAGYIVKHKIGPDTLVSVAKAGDIIPEIQNVIVESETLFELPMFCPSCDSLLHFDNIHLMCENETCKARIAKKLGGAIGVLDLQRIGGRTIEKFAEDFTNMLDLMIWVLIEGDTKQIEKYDIKHNSRSHEIFLDAFKNIKSLSYEQVIRSLGIDNVGKKISIQLAKEHAGLEPDYSGLERALVDKMRLDYMKVNIEDYVSTLEKLGITIDRPKEVESTNGVYVCMTGSPKDFGFKTKDEFVKNFPNIIEVSLTDPKCEYLITDSYTSSSGKMKTAEKKGITIKTYGDFDFLS